MVACELSHSSTGDLSGVRFGVLDEFLHRGCLKSFFHGQTDGGILDNRQNDKIIGLESNILHEDGLENDVRDAESADRVPVRFGCRQLGPAERPSRTGKILDHKGNSQVLLEIRLHGPGRDVHLSARVEGIHVVDRSLGKILSPCGCSERQKT